MDPVPVDAVNADHETLFKAGQIFHELQSLGDIKYSSQNISDKRLVVKGKVEKAQEFKYQLLDSGACVNSISQELIKKYDLTHKFVPIKDMYGSGFGGAKYPILGVAELSISNGSSTYTGPFVVFEKMKHHDIILGTPFLKKYGLLEDLKSKISSVFGSGVVYYESKNN